MRAPATALLAVLLAAMAAVRAAAQSAPAPCPGGDLGAARIVAIDATAGPLYGDITRYAKEERFLAPREVVLTFDDGPMPWITRSILDTLDRFCTKATFFSVGRMALAYPAMVKEVIARGHTLGAHTHTHPLNITRLKTERAIDEIERGFAAISLAAGQPIAPFFRFPGLSDSPRLLDHLQQRGIAAFTVDVVSNDSFISDPNRLARLTLERIEARQGGIVLFHDIKASTAKALPQILAELNKRGYKVVHLRATTPVVPMARYEAELAPRLAKAKAANPPGAKAALLPFYGAEGPERVQDAFGISDAERAGAANAQRDREEQNITVLSPAPRQRLAAVESTAARTRRGKSRSSSPTARRSTAGTTFYGSAVNGWSTEVRPSRR